MDIHVDLEQVKFFACLVIVGSLYGYHCYKRGIRRGWDDLAYSLEEEGLIQIGEQGAILRVSDRDFKNFQEERDC